MFSHLSSLCLRQSTRQFQTSTCHLSLKGLSVSVKRPQAKPVKTCFPINKFHNKSRKNRTSDDLDWRFLDWYHISLNQVGPLEFFCLQELPQPSVNQELLNIVDADAMQKGRNRGFIRFLDLVMIPEPSVPVIDFTAKVFDFVGYLGNGRVASQRKNLPLVIGGEPNHQKPDVCIFDLYQNEIFLVGQEDKMTELGGTFKARTKLVAGAVAAFDHNNLEREKAKLPPLMEKVMPGIVMAGTSPSFFKIPVTKSLSSHIRSGTCPPCETRVTYCYTPVPFNRRHEGMKPLDNRHEILKCYEAFKVFVR